MIVAPTGPAGPATRARRAPAPGGFRVPDDPEPTAAQAVAEPAATGLHGLLALQEAAADDQQDRAARRQAGSMLAELSALQRAMLRGSREDIAAALGQLQALAVEPAAIDPRLAAVVRAIVQRAAIEAARHADAHHPAATG